MVLYMINSDFLVKNLGGGVVVFKNAISLDWDSVFDVAEMLVDLDSPSMYKPALDPETGEQVLSNKSEYIYSQDAAGEMPRRCSVAHQSQDDKVIKLLEELESAKDECLLHYFWEYPLAYKVVWWKVKGHFVSYSPTKGGLYLGVHSDTSADYAYGFEHPKQQLATRNSVSCLVYLNDCVDTEEELNGKNFTGGHHYFNYLNLTYKPQKGDILMFPSNYVAAHEVKTVTGGHRYTYLGWYAHGTPNQTVGEYVVEPTTNPSATNVYMPSLREDVIAFADKKDPSRTSFLHTLASRIW
jgi:hypothetical protein